MSETQPKEATDPTVQQKQPQIKNEQQQAKIQQKVKEDTQIVQQQNAKEDIKRQEQQNTVQKIEQKSTEKQQQNKEGKKDEQKVEETKEEKNEQPQTKASEKLQQTKENNKNEQEKRGGGWWDKESEQDQKKSTEAKVQNNKKKQTPKKQEDKKIQQIISKQSLNEKPQNFTSRPSSFVPSKEIIGLEKEQKFQIAQLQIKLRIVDSEQKGFAIGKQTYYHIVGQDKHGPIDITRKSVEFQSLRKILLQRWPGCFVSPLSSNSLLKDEQMRKQHKRKNYQDFLMKIARFQFIYYKQQVQLFLRSEGVDCVQMYDQMPVLKINSVTQRFKAVFGQDIQGSNPADVSNITKFSTCLKKIAHNLNDLSKRSIKLAQSYDNYSKKMPKIGQVLKKYEKCFFSLQVDHNPEKFIALKQSNDNFYKLQSLSENNPFYSLHFMLDRESRDAQALSDIILAMEMFSIKRDDLDTKSRQIRLQIDQISLGHKNMKSMTSRKPKEELIAEMQQKQKQLIEEKHKLNQLAGISQKILASITIPTFKIIKKQAYIIILKNWIDNVGSVNVSIHQLWKFIQEEAKKDLEQCK